MILKWLCWFLRPLSNFRSERRSRKLTVDTVCLIESFDTRVWGVKISYFDSIAFASSISTQVADTIRSDMPKPDTSDVTRAWFVVALLLYVAGPRRLLPRRSDGRDAQERVGKPAVVKVVVAPSVGAPVRAVGGLQTSVGRGTRWARRQSAAQAQEAREHGAGRTASPTATATAAHQLFQLGGRGAQVHVRVYQLRRARERKR